MSRNLRNRPRIVSPAVLRLWNFHPEHVRDGPADGVPITITGLPATLSSVTSTTYYWIELDLAASTATWASGAGLPGGDAEGDADTEYWPILKLTCSVADEVITDILQYQLGDIHITRTA